MQQVIKEEDCTKNFLMIGLAEEDKEDTSKVVDGVLKCIGIKLKNEAVRIGLKTKSTSDDSTKPRPVKVSVGRLHRFRVCSKFNFIPGKLSAAVVDVLK